MPQPRKKIMTTHISKQLLDLLVCPNCGKPLKESAESLDCAGCRLSYPIRDGIAVLLVDQAQPLGEGNRAR